MLENINKMLSKLTDTPYFQVVFLLVIPVAFLLESLTFAIVCHATLLLTKEAYDFYINKPSKAKQVTIPKDE